MLWFYCCCALWDDTCIVKTGKILEIENSNTGVDKCYFFNFWIIICCVKNKKKLEIMNWDLCSSFHACGNAWYAIFMLGLSIIGCWQWLQTIVIDDVCLFCLVNSWSRFDKIYGWFRRTYNTFYNTPELQRI